MTPLVKRRIYQSYALADRASGRLAGAFEACMSLARDEFPIKKAETLLSQGKGHLVATAVEPLLARAAKRYNEFSYDEYSRAKIIEAVNSEEVTHKVKRDLAKAAKQGNDYSRWGLRNQKSIKHHIKNRGRLIREITEDQRKTIFAVIDRMQGENPRVVAAEIKKSLGLTAHQSRIVGNYHRELASGGQALRQSMARKLRDKRADASLKRYMAAEKPLPKEKVDSLVDRYRKNWRRHRAETIARTEAMSAVNAGQNDVWEELVEKGEVPKDRVKKFWVATRDVRTRPSHAMTPKLNAEGRLINESFITGLGNRLKHPGDMSAPAADVANCFPDYENISTAGLQGVITRNYCGEIVKFTLRNGASLSTTPNHPILTKNRGFVPAGSLNEGDQVVNGFGSDGRINPENGYGYSSAQELAELPSIPIEHRRTRLARFDFDSDPVHKEVKVIRFPRELRDDFKSLAVKEFGNFPLVLSDIRQGLLLGQCFPVLLAIRHNSATPSLVHFVRKFEAFLVRQFGHANLVGFGPSPLWEPQVFETMVNDSARATELSGHGLDRVSEMILGFNFGQKVSAFLSPVIRIERSEFIGLVHNFESSNGLIIGNGIVTHNCRCTTVYRPITSTGQGTRPGKPGDAELGVSGQVSGGGSRYGLGPSGVPTKSISIGAKDLPAPMEGVPFKARSAIGDVLNRRTKAKLPHFNPRRIKRAEPPDGFNIGAELAYDIPLEGSFAVVEGNEARIRNRPTLDYDYLISLLDASALLGIPADEMINGAYDLDGRRLG